MSRFWSNAFIAIGLICTFLLFTGTVVIASPLPACRAFLAESIPDNLTYMHGGVKHISTAQAWTALLQTAKTELKMTSFYWTLLHEDVVPSTSYEQGEAIFQLFKQKASEINMTIVQNGNEADGNDETKALAKAGAKMVYLDVGKLLGTGIVHSKLWAIDGEKGYIGSANMDLRSLTQVKELGIVFYDCPIIINDLKKIIETFQLVGNAGPPKPKEKWPTYLLTKYNRINPMQIDLNGVPSKVYITSSPPPFTPPGRNDDLDAVLNIIHEAKEFIYISVMTYSPLLAFYDGRPSKFWPIIDNALRQATVDRGVKVRLLISKWKHTSKESLIFLDSLRVLNNAARKTSMRVRMFEVPSYTDAQRRIPFARVNHNKYMVTDKTVYIGTSNWSGDYFLYTTGSAFVAEQGHERETSGNKNIRQQVESIFYRDWNSEFAFEM